MQSNGAYQEKKAYALGEICTCYVHVPILTYKFPIFIDLTRMRLGFLL